VLSRKNLTADSLSFKRLNARIPSLNHRWFKLNNHGYYSNRVNNYLYLHRKHRILMPNLGSPKSRFVN